MGHTRLARVFRLIAMTVLLALLLWPPAVRATPAADRAEVHRQGAGPSDSSLARPVVLGATATPTSTRRPTRTLTESVPAVATVVLQNGLAGYVGCDDTYINKAGQNSNCGGCPTMDMRPQNDPVAQMNLLVRFDLSPLAHIPPDATIDTAVLSLWCTWSSNPSELRAINSYRLLRPWSEMQATWNVARTGDPWGQPGALQVGVDRAASTTSPGYLATAGICLYQNWTPMVQRWRDSPGLNHGAVITSSAWASVTYRFASSEYATPALRPRLVVTYTNPTATVTATPAPALWLPLLRKRR